MAFRYFFSLSFIICLSSTSFAQNNFIDRGDQYFEEFDFIRAIESYEKAVKRDSSNAYAMHQIAESYRLIGENQKANPWYALAIKVNPNSKEDLYYYARTLLAVGKYDKALEYYQKYNSLYPNDPRAAVYVDNPEFYNTLTQFADRYDIFSLPINSELSDYGPARVYSQIIFTSSRDREIAVKHKSTWKNQPFLDLYLVDKLPGGQYDNPILIGDPITTKWHEGSASFDKNQNLLYFTRTSLDEKKLETDREGIVNIEIYTSYLTDDNTWEEIQPFPYNNKEYSIAQPAVAPDGKTIYFVSDMPGGLGGTDLYYCTWKDGQWTAPENLGPPVNTASHEKNPYVDPLGNLYFASTGHLGLGGYDIYKAENMGDAFDQPQNLGFPINTRFDDFSFTFEDDSLRTFLFASNREGGKGEDDIYRGSPVAVPFTIAGYVGTKESLKDIPITLLVKDQTGKVIASDTITNHKAFNLTAQSFDTPYKIEFYPLFENELLGSIDPIDPDKSPNNSLDLGEIILGEDVIAATDGSAGQVTDPVTDPDAFITTTGKNNEGIVVITDPKTEKQIEKSAGPVYYGFNRYDLDQKAINELEDVIDILNTLPDIEVTISGHADSRGSKQYNLVLSQKRANSALDYLEDHGVDVSRVNVVGYGESKPVNECVDGVNCPEEKHAKNRRTEFEFKK